MLKICTVYYNGIYSPDYVSKLYNGLKKHSTIPFEFICLSDTDVEADLVLPYNHSSDIKKHWHKLKFFSPDFPFLDLFSMSCLIISRTVAVLPVPGIPEM